MKLLLIAVQGLNTHWPGPYGNEWVATPRLDALAGESFVFDNHFCTSPDPAGFRHSWQSASQAGPDFLEELSARKIHTLFLNHTADSPTGNWQSIVATLPGERKSLWSLAREAAKRLAGADDWFVCVETSQLLPPWTIKAPAFAKHADLSELNSPAEPLTPWPDPARGPHTLDNKAWERLRLSFACAIEELDRDIALVRGSFFPKPAEDALIILTGTHGLPLGEHGHVGPHPTTIHGEEVHVPFMICSAESRTAPRRVARFTTHEDLRGIINRSFEPGSTTATPWIPAMGAGRTEMVATRQTLAGPAIYHRDTDWSYNVPAGVRLEEGNLYSQPDDLWETMNLAQTQPGPVEEITGRLRTILSGENRS